MSDQDNTILREFAERVRAVLPDAEVIAFGSRVLGTATWESDFDLCVVSAQMNSQMDEKISEIAWETGFPYDVVISTVTYNKEEYHSGRFTVSPLVQVIKLMGIAA